MRYADTVLVTYSTSLEKPRYDATLGRMVKAETVTKAVKCNVTGASLDLQAKFSDVLNSNSLVFRFRAPLGVSVVSLEYHGGTYTPVTVRGYLAGVNTIYGNKAVK